MNNSEKGAESSVATGMNINIDNSGEENVLDKHAAEHDGLLNELHVAQDVYEDRAAAYDAMEKELNRNSRRLRGLINKMDHERHIRREEKFRSRRRFLKAGVPPGWKPDGSLGEKDIYMKQTAASAEKARKLTMAGGLGAGGKLERRQKPRETRDVHWQYVRGNAILVCEFTHKRQ